MSEIGQLFQPSQYSLTGTWITSVDSDSCLNPELHGVITSETPIAERIGFLAFKILSAIVLMGCAVVDLALWTCMTITVIPVVRVGGLSHLANLVATLAVPILALRIPFGWNLVLHQSRPFMCPIDPKTTKTFYSSLERVGNITSDRLKALVEERKVDVDTPLDSGGNTPLTQVLLKAHNQTIDEVTKKALLLLKAGANPNPKTGLNSPLKLAVAQGLPRVVEELLKRNADPLRLDQDGDSLFTQIVTSKSFPWSEVYGVFVYALRFYPAGQDIARNYKRFEDDNVDIAMQLIHAEVPLDDAGLNELDALRIAIKDNNVDDINAIIARDNARYRKIRPNDFVPEGQTLQNPYIRDLKEKLNHPNDARIFLSNFLERFNWIIANREKLQKIKADIVKNRTEAVFHALESCSEHGMPKPLVELISHYCYS